MCYEYEARQWAALREEVEVTEADDEEEEPVDVTAEFDDWSETGQRLPPIQPSD